MAESAWRMQARGPVLESDNSMWACLKRIVDPRTGKPLARAALTPEMAGLFSGALDTTSQTCAITLCALIRVPVQAGPVHCKAPGKNVTSGLPARLVAPRCTACAQAGMRAGTQLQWQAFCVLVPEKSTRLCPVMLSVRLLFWLHHASPCCVVQ